MAKPARFGATEPLQIYQDDFFDQQTPIISHAPMPLAAKPPRRPLQPSNRNVVLNPPNASSVQKSPFKSNQRIPETPLTPMKPTAQGNSLNMVPMMPPNSLQQSTDCLEKKQPLMARFKTVAQKPPQQQHNQQPVQTHPDLATLQFNMGKENSHVPIYPAGPQFNLPLENYYPKPNGKRVLLEAAPIKELRPAKKPKLEEPLPTPDSFPPIYDDGTKPNHSYATLIGMAILRSPERRLTLAQIYKWISDTFSFYNPNDAGWQNSIRHNLSLNKNFIKKERPKDDPGKGNYWAIEPGTEHLFMKEKPSRKVVPTLENIPVMSATHLEPSQPHMYESMLPPQPPMSQASLPVLPQAMSSAPSTLPPDISSDATIPMSELGTLDDVTDRAPETDAQNETDLYSPLPAAIHSSPPIPKHIDVRHSGTPPQLRLQQPHASSSSKSQSRKRRFTSMDDSGYISSLESSAMRPNQHAKLLTSEADRPRLKRGRAEEEIARLRASSYDSPSKGRSYGYPPVSSSPLRHNSNNGAGQMLPPLTPAMKLKAPSKPPPSVSPSTNLRLHRESVQSMVDSPYRRVGALLPADPVLQLTPGFNVEELMFGFDHKTEDDTLGFDIFQDTPFGALGAPAFSLSPAVALNGSPTKRSAKRQKLDRSLSTGALNDTPKSVSNNSLNNFSFLKVPGQPSHNFVIDTPSKVFDGLPSSPSKLFLDSPSKVPLGNEENMAPWLNMDSLETPDFLEEGDFGIDMLAGFEKIGSSNPQSSRPVNKGPQKPSFGRCFSTAF